MLLAHSQSKKRYFIVDDKYSTTLEVLQTRARPLGINIVKVDLDKLVDLESVKKHLVL